MDTELISMEPAKAREAWQNYRAAIKKRHTAEDEILMRGYKHLAQGKKILDLIQVMKKIGVDSQGRPQLAIARASWEECWFESRSDGVGRFANQRWPFYMSSSFHRQRVEMPVGFFPREVKNIFSRVPPHPSAVQARRFVGKFSYSLGRYMGNRAAK